MGISTQRTTEREGRHGPLQCDVCGGDLAAEYFDAKTTGGPWASLCRRCWKIHTRGRLGVGIGQRYNRDAAGKWFKVAG